MPLETSAFKLCLWCLASSLSFLAISLACFASCNFSWAISSSLKQAELFSWSLTEKNCVHSWSGHSVLAFCMEKDLTLKQQM
jgi:hypothetical protein